jgi:hypothetical protein
MSRETKGITIHGIQLVQTRFDWRASQGDIEKLNRIPAAQRAMVSTTGVATGAVPSIGEIHRQFLRILVKGLANDVLIWEIEATYQVGFTCEPGSEVSVEDIRRLHAPGWLYSYAREYVSDLARRANLGDLVLAPLNFQVPGPSEQNR